MNVVAASRDEVRRGLGVKEDLTGGVVERVDRKETLQIHYVSNE